MDSILPTNIAVMVVVLFPPLPLPSAFEILPSAAPDVKFGPTPKINTLIPKEPTLIWNKSVLIYHLELVTKLQVIKVREEEFQGFLQYTKILHLDHTQRLMTSLK